MLAGENAELKGLDTICDKKNILFFMYNMVYWCILND